MCCNKLPIQRHPASATFTAQRQHLSANEPPRFCAVSYAKFILQSGKEAHQCPLLGRPATTGLTGTTEAPSCSTPPFFVWQAAPESNTATCKHVFSYGCPPRYPPGIYQSRPVDRDRPRPLFSHLQVSYSSLSGCEIVPSHSPTNARPRVTYKPRPSTQIPPHLAFKNISLVGSQTF